MEEQHFYPSTELHASQRRVANEVKQFIEMPNRPLINVHSSSLSGKSWTMGALARELNQEARNNGIGVRVSWLNCRTEGKLDFVSLVRQTVRQIPSDGLPHDIQNLLKRSSQIGIIGPEGNLLDAVVQAMEHHRAVIFMDNFQYVDHECKDIQEFIRKSLPKMCHATFVLISQGAVTNHQFMDQDLYLRPLNVPANGEDAWRMKNEELNDELRKHKLTLTDLKNHLNTDESSLTYPHLMQFVCLSKYAEKLPKDTIESLKMFRHQPSVLTTALIEAMFSADEKKFLQTIGLIRGVRPVHLLDLIREDILPEGTEIDRLLEIFGKTAFLAYRRDDDDVFSMACGVIDELAVSAPRQEITRQHKTLGKSYSRLAKELEKKYHSTDRDSLDAQNALAKLISVMSEAFYHYEQADCPNDAYGVITTEQDRITTLLSEGEVPRVRSWLCALYPEFQYSEPSKAVVILRRLCTIGRMITVPQMIQHYKQIASGIIAGNAELQDEGYTERDEAIALTQEGKYTSADKALLQSLRKAINTDSFSLQHKILLRGARLSLLQWRTRQALHRISVLVELSGRSTFAPENVDKHFVLSLLAEACLIMGFADRAIVLADHLHSHLDPIDQRHFRTAIAHYWQVRARCLKIEQEQEFHGQRRYALHDALTKFRELGLEKGIESKFRDIIDDDRPHVSSKLRLELQQHVQDMRKQHNLAGGMDRWWSLEFDVADIQAQILLETSDDALITLSERANELVNAYSALAPDAAYGQHEHPDGFGAIQLSHERMLLPLLILCEVHLKIFESPTSSDKAKTKARIDGMEVLDQVRGLLGRVSENCDPVYQKARQYELSVRFGLGRGNTELVNDAIAATRLYLKASAFYRASSCLSNIANRDVSVPDMEDVLEYVRKWARIMAPEHFETHNAVAPESLEDIRKFVEELERYRFLPVALTYSELSIPSTYERVFAEAAAMTRNFADDKKTEWTRMSLQEEQWIMAAKAQHNGDQQSRIGDRLADTATLMLFPERQIEPWRFMAQDLIMYLAIRPPRYACTKINCKLSIPAMGEKEEEIVEGHTVDIQPRGILLSLDSKNWDHLMDLKNQDKIVKLSIVFPENSSCEKECRITREPFRFVDNLGGLIKYPDCGIALEFTSPLEDEEFPCSKVLPCRHDQLCPIMVGISS
jgi:hypothetical protein